MRAEGQQPEVRSHLQGAVSGGEAHLRLASVLCNYNPGSSSQRWHSYPILDLTSLYQESCVLIRVRVLVVSEYVCQAEGK